MATIRKKLKYAFFKKKAPRLAHAMYAASMVCKMQPGDQISADRIAAVIQEHGFMQMKPDRMASYLRIARRSVK